MSSFPSVEFDWVGHRVRLGSFWKQTEATLSGRPCLSRAVVVNSVVLDRGNTEGKWNINSNLRPFQKQQLMDLLDSFSDVFAINPKAPSVTDLIHHQLNTDGEQPVKARIGRVSPQMEKKIVQQVEEMLENKIIRPSSSPWASRVLLVTKRDGGIRFAVDYRALNSITRKDSYPLPIVRDLLDKLDGSRIFTSWMVLLPTGVFH